MKKIILAGVLSLFSVVSMAQFRPSIIVSAGYQGANISTGEYLMKTSMKSSFRAGVSVDIDVYDFLLGKVSVQPGLFYSSKGASIQLTGNLIPGLDEYINQAGYGDVLKGVKGTTNLGYLEMPILANVSFGVGSNLSAFVNAGPYIAYGLHGHSNRLSDFNIPAELKDIVGDVDANNVDLEDPFKGGTKRFDAGIQVGAGAEYKRIMLTVGAQFGLTNLNKSIPQLNAENGIDLTTGGVEGIQKMFGNTLSGKNRTFFVTLGYRF